MARRIRWQILIAAVSSLLVLGLMGYLAITTAAVARPVAGGAYVEGLFETPQQLNPLVAHAALDPAADDIHALVFEGLMRSAPDGLPAPALAQSWELDDSGMVYTFTLRPDVTWHDGTPFGIEDALFTIRTIQSPAYAGDPGVAAIWRTVLVDQVGERSFRCRLPAPFAPFLSLATFPILPAHLLRDVPPEQWSTGSFSRAPIGTGPYQLTELTADHAMLKANPAYYGGRPFLDSIELRFLADTAAAVGALNRGELKGIGFMSTSELAQANLPREITRHMTPLDNYSILAFNMRSGPLADQELRQALALALDKDELIARTLADRAVRLDTPILPGSWAATPDIPWYPADKGRAAEALTTLGYLPGPDGMRSREGAPLAFTILTDNASDRVAAAQEIARQWGIVGVQVEVRQLDSEQLRQQLATHTFMIALHGWQRLGTDPDQYELWHSSQAAAGNNYAGLEDRQIDKLLVDAREDNDIISRAATYAAFQRRWIDLAPSITLYQPLFVYVITPELSGVDAAEIPSETLASDQMLEGRRGRFRNVTRWFLRSTREIRGDLRQLR